MPRTIIFDKLTNVTIHITKDPSPISNHEITINYSWLAQDGELRPQPSLNIFPWLQKNNPQALALITNFYNAVIQAVKERDGIA